MARLIEFSRRSTTQLQKILIFYDERNGSDVYSRRLLRCLLDELHRPDFVDFCHLKILRLIIR